MKQWEVYDRGVVLIYDQQQHVEDEHGFLSDQSFDPRRMV